MKKIYLFLMLFAATALNAQVAFLKVEETYSAEADGGQHPELNAYNWFKTTYEDQSKGKIISMTDVLAITPENYKVLWINVDRNINISAFDALSLFSQEVRTAITNYVKAGGNLYLSTHATRIIGPDYINRASYPSFAENNAFANGSDHWKVIASNGARGGDKSHSIYTYLISEGKEVNGEANRFYMQYGGGGNEPRSDRNCIWDVQGNEEAINSFQNNNSCRILGSFGHNDYVSVVGIAEFYPKNDFKGTVITNGLAACSFAEANANKDCVQYLTKGILDYLSKRATATWETAPKANPVIKDEENVIVTPGTNCTVTVATSDPNIANYNEGHIYYNFFGDVTFTATATGDGVNIPKNAVLYPETRTVTGGAAATYAYALPYSLYTMQHYDNEEGFYPDYQAAKWFYDNYVALGTGCFINPTAYSASATFPSAINVLWVNNDHVGLARDTYYDNLGGNNFKDTLEAFVKAGGKVFLSMQATRLANDIGRVSVAPEYRMNGWQGRDENARYMTADFYALKDANESRVGLDRHNHPVYKYLPAEAWVTHNEGGQDVYCKWQLMDFTDANRRTDNNAIWENHWDGYADAVHLARATTFEENHHCVILGGYGHTTALDGVGFVEFYPYGDYNGTVIALGLHSYEWGTNNSLVANVQYLTKGTLEYLASADIYTRNVPADHYGTICLPRASASLSDGMTVYRVLSDETDGIMLEEVNAMEAGVPYFFYSTATTISVTMTGAAVLTPQNGNGLIGNFGPASVEIPNEMDNYILGSDNTLYYIDQEGIMLDANRAYLDRSTINQSTPSGMPKRVMGIHKAPSVVTALDNTGSQNILPVKKLINGRLVIQVGDQLYDVTGTQVK